MRYLLIAMAALSISALVFVSPRQPRELNFGSLKQIRGTLADLREKAKENGVDGEAAGTDYFESYEYFLEDRVNPGADSIDVEAYDRAIEHRNEMPPAVMASGPAGSKLITGNWQFVGPSNMDVPYRIYYGVRPIAGRIGAIAYDPHNNQTVYVGGSNGGVWKSTDAGVTWTILNTDTWDYLHVSSIAVDPTNSSVVYVGTGDYQGGLPYSFGIMKSTNGGSTWTNLGRSDFGFNAVSDIIIDPDNTQLVTISTGRGFNSGNGHIWRSTNGGSTWSIATGSPTGNWSNLSIATSNAGTKAYYATYGGGLYTSTNQGANWSPVTAPFGAAADVACSRRTTGTGPTTLFVLDTTNNKIWRTVDAGTNWTDVTAGFPNGSSNYNWSQKTYDYWIGTSTGTGTNDVVYVGLITVAASKDGGSTWADIGSTYTGGAITHNDQHAFALDPANPNVALTGCDGGVYRCTYNPTAGTATFQGLSSQLGISMFYAMAAHPSDSTRLLGGTQDNASPNSNGDLAIWNCRYAGDGGYCAIDATNPQIQYSCSQYLGTYRTTDEWATFNDISPNTSGETTAFIAPISLSANQGILYALTNRFRSYNGTTWNGAGTGQLISSAGTGRCIGIAKSDDARVYTGASDGQVWMTTDAPAATQWTEIDSGTPSLPVGSVKDIAVHPTNPSDVLVCFGGTGFSHLWRCANTQAGTRVWIDVSGTGGTALPDVPTNTVERDPFDPANTWYVGNDVGVFRTTNAGATWTNATAPLNLPNVRVNDLLASKTTNYLYAATYGRGMWRIRLVDFGLQSVSVGYTAVVGGFAFSGAVNMTTPAPNGGWLVTLSTTNSAALSIPASVTVPAGASSASFALTSHPVAVDTNVSIGATFNGKTLNRLISVRTPHPLAVQLVPTYCAGGGTVTCRVDLNGVAPTGGTTVAIADNSASVATPATLLIPAGQRFATFTVSTSAVSSLTTASISASRLGYAAAAVLNIYPFLLSNLTVSPSSVTAGINATGTVTLTGAAPAGGANVIISSNKPAVASVTSPAVVAAGTTSKGFAIVTHATATSQVVTITAQRGPVTKTSSLTVNP